MQVFLLILHSSIFRHHHILSTQCIQETYIILKNQLWSSQDNYYYNLENIREHMHLLVQIDQGILEKISALLTSEVLQLVEFQHLRRIQHLKQKYDFS